jgi:CRISPR-associated protein Cas6/Cse3/CasE subtype I-E
MFGARSEERDFTFRADEDNGSFRFLVQSRLEPNLSAIRGIAQKTSSCFIPDSNVVPGTYDFSVRLNSAKRDKITRKLKPRANDETIEWFKAKMMESGAEVTSVGLSGTCVRPARRKNGDHHNAVRHVVELKGEVRVFDSERFIKRLLDGVGRSKFEGHGLIVLS